RNNGGGIELRTVDEDGSPGDVLATGEFVADGGVRLEAPEKMETDRVMVWIPELPADRAQQGRVRARLAASQAGGARPRPAGRPPPARAGVGRASAPCWASRCRWC